MEKEIEIMDFVKKEQNRRNMEKNLVNNKQNDRSKQALKIKAYLKLALLAGISFSLIKLYKYETRPIKIVVNELTSDSGLNFTDEGKTINGTMTQEELANYAIEKGLTIEQIEEELNKYSEKRNLDYDYVEEQVKTDNEELFKSL